MPAVRRPVPVLQVRAIGAANHVQAVLTAVAQAAAVTLGPNITTRTHTRSAGRIGYVPAYLTITRRETNAVHTNT